MTTTPLLAHAIGHTIIRAVVGDHESGLQILGHPVYASDYVSNSNATTSWSAFEFRRSPDTSDLQNYLLNELCINVAGFVGESVFYEADSLICAGENLWNRSGRRDLQGVYELCKLHANTHDKSIEAVIEACMEVVETRLRKYHSVADRLFEILLDERSVNGYRFAALLASIAQEDLSLLVCEQVGMPSCIDVAGED